MKKITKHQWIGLIVASIFIIVLSNIFILGAIVYFVIGISIYWIVKEISKKKSTQDK